LNEPEKTPPTAFDITTEIPCAVPNVSSASRMFIERATSEYRGALHGIAAATSAATAFAAKAANAIAAIKNFFIDIPRFFSMV
jgi:hypothetical protein